MIAGDLMTTGAATVHPWDAITEAARTMVSYGVSGLPVVDAENRVVGMVSERDLLRRVELGTEFNRPRWLDLWFEPEILAAEYARSRGRKVEDVMSTNVVSIDVETPATEIVNLMEDKGFKRIPVIRDGKLVGIVSRANLIVALSRRIADQEPSMEGDLVLRRRIIDELTEKTWSEGAAVDVQVRDGSVTLRGTVDDERIARAIRVAAENTPGVRKVLSLIRTVDAKKA